MSMCVLCMLIFFCLKSYVFLPDVCYMANFEISGRKIWEKVGWKSNGITPQADQQYKAKRI